jgi:hypothetical protein
MIEAAQSCEMKEIVVRMTAAGADGEVEVEENVDDHDDAGSDRDKQSSHRRGTWLRRLVRFAAGKSSWWPSILVVSPLRLSTFGFLELGRGAKAAATVQSRGRPAALPP